MEKTTEFIFYWLRICSIICFFFFSTNGFGQIDIAVQSESFSNYCEEFTYLIELEKTSSVDQGDIILEIQFSESVSYISNTLGLEPIEINPRLMTFTVNDISDCVIINGAINILPECYDIFTTIETTFSLKSASDCISETSVDIVIKNPFMDIAFSDYVYDPENETLTKNLTLFNAGSIVIQSFYLLPTINQDFARLTSTSLGSIRNDTLFVDEADLNNAVIPSGNEIIIELIYSINRCDIRSINYELGYRCASANCQTTQLFVDENDIYQNDVQAFLQSELINFSKQLNYGICEAPRNTITFRNSILMQETSIGDIYSIGYLIEIEDRFSRRFNECITLTASIGGQSLLVTQVTDGQLALSFDNILP